MNIALYFDNVRDVTYVRLLTNIALIQFILQIMLQVTLSEKYLVSVCSEYNHVRSWAVTRFRGMISTQPGSTPEASFKIVSLEAIDPCVSYNAGNDFGTLQLWIVLTISFFNLQLFLNKTLIPMPLFSLDIFHNERKRFVFFVYLIFE